MIRIHLPWDQMSSRGPFRYTEAHSNFYIFSGDDQIEFSCVLDTDSSDAQDFRNNYADQSTSL